MRQCKHYARQNWFLIWKLDLAHFFYWATEDRVLPRRVQSNHGRRLAKIFTKNVKPTLGKVCFALGAEIGTLENFLY